jgi:acetoacetyl-CoA reductase
MEREINTMRAKIAIVTGAARGIGAAISAALHREGWLIIGVDRAWPESIAPCFKAIETIDVTDFGAVSAMVAQIEQTHGPIGLVVNNAGITRDGVAHKMDPADFRAVLDVNLVGPFHLCRAVLPGMRERGYGRIVNMSSVNGQRGQGGQANYAAAKAGLIAMTKSIALEGAAKGITANCVAPGFIKTDMTDAMRTDMRDLEISRIPAGRIGTPDDIAEAVVYLASDKAAFITGHVMSVNGGQLMP